MRMGETTGQSCLEILPPRDADNQNQRILLSVIHSFLRQHKNRVRQPEIGFEIRANKSGLRFYLFVDQPMSAGLKSLVLAHLPTATVKSIAVPSLYEPRIALQTYQKLGRGAINIDSATDPLAYIAEAMANLRADEHIIYQLVARADDPSSMTNKLKKTFKILVRLPTIVFKGLLTSQPKPSISQPISRMGPYFRSSLRLAIVTNDPNRQELHLKTVQAALSLTKSDTANIKLVNGRLTHMLINHQIKAFQDKRLGIYNFWLSTDELSVLLHFPNQNLLSGGIAWTLSRQLPLPAELRSVRQGTLIGQNLYHEAMRPIKLRTQDRQRHLFVLGGTGVGKTTLLYSLARQDIETGRGLALIDPHGDLAKDVIRIIPTDRLKDVIYFDPSDLEHPIAINLLERSPGLSGPRRAIEEDLITEAAISIFRKLFAGEDTFGHRIEYILRNCIQTTLTLNDATLATIYDLLTIPSFRKQVSMGLKDERLKNFWQKEIGSAGAFQRVKLTHGVTSKLGRFLFSAVGRPLIDQPRSTINFDQLLQKGQILVCNFAKGKIGEDTASLFGMVVMARLQIAALKRIHLEKASRQEFYLYVDEVQNFNPSTINQLLSEARKFGLYLTLAQQSIAQQDTLRSAHQLLANVGNLICFRTASSYDEKLLKPLFSPYIQPTDLANLPAFSFYMRSLNDRPVEPFSGQTIYQAERGSQKTADQVISRSRSQYGLARPQYSPKELELVG